MTAISRVQSIAHLPQRPQSLVLNLTLPAIPRNVISTTPTFSTSTQTRTKQSIKRREQKRMAALRSVLAFMIFLVAFATAQSGLFALTVYQPGSPLDGQAVNAAGEAFYLGGSPATYCPLTDQTLCPAGNQTIFAGMGALFVSTLG